MKIVVDAMGGDHAPKSVIEGTIEALEYFYGFEVILVGNLNELKPYIETYRLDKNPRIKLVHAEQFVRMDESSTVSLRQKKNSSITVAASIVGDKKADALVTIGHTGAAMAATTVRMRTLPGVERPAIAVIMPSTEGKFILLDAGANVDCKPQNLAQFAVMGELYSKHVLGVRNPKIGIMSVGDEDIKGNELTKEAFKILTKMPINFIGNVEGNDMFENKADVVVCDGFVGNVVLKSCEGLSKAIQFLLKKAFMKNPIRITSAILGLKAFAELKDISDKETYGGAPLLGINGICIIGHGSSSSKAVCNAIKIAADLVEKDLNGEILKRLKESNIIVEKE
jgi:phosphate acyltransferase